MRLNFKGKANDRFYRYIFFPRWYKSIQDPIEAKKKNSI